MPSDTSALGNLSAPGYHRATASTTLSGVSMTGTEVI
jgi:hypothetical protein